MAKREIKNVTFALCLFLLVNFGSSDESQNTNENTTPSPPEESDLSFLREYLNVFQLKKFHEEFKELKAAYKKVGELSEQVKLLTEKMDGISEDGGVWLLTPPLRGPPGPKGDKGDSALTAPKEKDSDSRISDPQQEISAESCVPEEKWVNLHELNNTSPSDVKTVVNATVGLERRNSTDDNSSAIFGAFFQAENFARLGKSKSTDFDWTATPFHMWTRETGIAKTYTCEAGSSCVLKQLVGHCGNARVPVDTFCQVLVPVGSSIPDSCADSKFSSCSVANEILPSPRSKKQIIYPHGNRTNLDVLCDFEVEGGGWTIIQKRTSGPQQEFNLNWNDYVKGFGSLQGNFWLGLDNIHALTQNGDQELRIQLEDFEGQKRWAKYSSFSISDASDFYRLNISGFYANSTAGDSMTPSGAANGARFSTKDKDHDNSSGNCASQYSTGGWWVSDQSDEFPVTIQSTKKINSCYYATPNGLYFGKGETISGSRIYWAHWKGGLAKTEIKIRTRK